MSADLLPSKLQPTVVASSAPWTCEEMTWQPHYHNLLQQPLVKYWQTTEGVVLRDHMWLNFRSNMVCIGTLSVLIASQCFWDSRLASTWHTRLLWETPMVRLDKSCKWRIWEAIPAKLCSNQAESTSDSCSSLTPTSCRLVIVNLCLFKITSRAPIVALRVASSNRWLWPGCQHQTQVNRQIVSADSAERLC